MSAQDALAEGFNRSIRLIRTQTIMEGASHCDFRFRVADDKELATEILLRAATFRPRFDCRRGAVRRYILTLKHPVSPRLRRRNVRHSSGWRSFICADIE